MVTHEDMGTAFSTIGGWSFIVVIWNQIKKALKPRLKGELTIKIG